MVSLLDQEPEALVVRVSYERIPVLIVGVSLVPNRNGFFVLVYKVRIVAEVNLNKVPSNELAVHLGVLPDKIVKYFWIVKTVVDLGPALPHVHGRRYLSLTTYRQDGLLVEVVHADMFPVEHLAPELTRVQMTSVFI